MSDPNRNVLFDLEELSSLLPPDERVSIPKSFPVDDMAVLGNQMYLRLAMKLVNAYAERMKDALTLYRPLPGDATRFHESMARIRLLNGSNQAGKTLTAEAEFARIARGKDPFNKRADKYLKMMAVGKDARHIGQVMWRKLYWSGAFDCIVDNETGFIRSVRPDPLNPTQIDPSDAARRKEWIPSPPLIPDSCIGSITWESMGEGIPKVVTLKNGTEMLWCTSNGAPPNGIQLDVAHFDEELTSDRWLPETLPRLLRFGGIFFWSATPQASTPQFFDLHKRAAAGDPDIEEFTLLIENNPYLPAESKEAFRRDMLALGDEEYQVRWKGKYAIQGREVYPTYDLRKQGITMPSIPSDWMIVIAVDPGTAISAFVPIGVPPSGDKIVVLGECEMRNKDADGFARELKLWLGGRRPEAYVIDKQAGCQVSMGRNDTVAEHYAKAMEDAGVPPSRLTGRNFAFGCNVPAARELSVKGYLNTGKLKFRTGHIPRLDKQIQGRYYDKANMERREKRTIHDLCDCYDSETEVLTDAGWRYFRDLSGVESLATVNLENDTIEYQIPSQLVINDHNGDMVRIGGGKRQRLDMLVTPSHRMVVQKQLHEHTTITTAERLCKYDRIKVAAKNWVGRDFDCPFDCELGDFAEFLGWYVAEGSCKKPRCPGHGYGVNISQVKKAGRERLEWLFARMPFKWYRVQGAYQSSSNKKLWSLLNPLGNKYTKVIPDWIRLARPEIIQRFLDGAVAGDGWRSGNGFRYTSVSKELANGVQELFLKVGRGVALSRRPAQPCLLRGAVSTNTKDQWWVTTRENPLCGLCTHGGSKPIFSTVHYSGKVYCATVPNGTLIVRRNGKVAVCGNCLEYAVAFFDDGGIYYREPLAPVLQVSAYDERLYKSFLKKIRR